MKSILHITKNPNNELADKLKAFNYTYNTVVDEIGMVFDFLKMNKVDIILIDLNIFLAKVEYFIKQIRIRYENSIEIFALIDSTDPELKKRLFDAGITDYIMNSASVDEIKEYFESYPKTHKISTEELKKINFAVIEDDDEQLDMMKTIMSINNINNVDYYQEGAEILDVKKEYDLYLVDIVLGNISGKKLIVKLREKFSNAIIIAMSGISNKALPSEVIELGADDFLAKPFDVSMLISKIKANAKNIRKFQEIGK